MKPNWNHPRFISFAGFLVLSFFLFPQLSQAQSSVIWSEDFTYADGTTAGPGGEWTSACGACLSGDWFEVRSGIFEGSDLNDWSVWQSQSIDISSCSTVDFSLLAAELGDHEGAGCGCDVNIDYFDVYYSVDGGPFVVIEDWLGDGEAGHTLSGDTLLGVFDDNDWGSHTITQAGIVGSSMVLRIEMRNTAGSEILQLDDIVVNCQLLLPENELSLKAKALENSVELTWTAGTTDLVEAFEVQRSWNGKTFLTVGKVEVAAQKLDEWHFSDPFTPEKVMFYRIKQVGANGAVRYSEIREVLPAFSGLALTSLFPNPNQGEFELSLQARKAGRLRIELVNPLGQVVLGQDQMLAEGSNQFHFAAQGLPAGVYTLVLRTQGTKLAQRVVIR